MTLWGKFRKRQRRCYELSGRYLLEHPKARMIYGTVDGQTDDGQTERVDHAWIVTDGIVYDPVLDKEFTEEMYEYVYAAIEIQRFTPKRFGILSSLYGHWGPFENVNIKEAALSMKTRSSLRNSIRNHILYGPPK